MEVKIKLNLKPVPAGVFGLGLVFFFSIVKEKWKICEILRKLVFGDVIREVLNQEQ